MPRKRKPSELDLAKEAVRTATAKLDGTFAAYAALAIARANYFDAMALDLSVDYPHIAVRWHELATRSLSEAIKSKRHGAKDEYAVLVRALEERQRTSEDFLRIYAGGGSGKAN